MEETDKEQLTAEAKELRQKVKYLQDQLSPLTRQREYQEKEIQRLNKALEEALSIQASPSSPPAFGGPEGASGLLRKQELVTQNELLKQQVKIFEDWSQIRYPPPPMAMEHTPPLPNSRLFHLPEYTWRPPCGGMRNQSSQVMDSPTARPVEPESTKNDREGPQ